MVAAHQQLCQEFGISISHITEQNSHNKVSKGKLPYNKLTYHKDVSDGEFACVKTKLADITKRSTEDSFEEVLDSKSFVEFGNKHLSSPGIRSYLSARIFSNLDPTEVNIFSFLDLVCDLGSGKDL